MFYWFTEPPHGNVAYIHTETGPMFERIFHPSKEEIVSNFMLLFLNIFIPNLSGGSFFFSTMYVNNFASMPVLSFEAFNKDHSIIIIIIMGYYTVLLPARSETMC